MNDRDEVTPRFKAGQDGGPAPETDDRVERWGSTLKTRPGWLKRSTKKPGRDVTAQAVYVSAKIIVSQRAGGRCEAEGLHHRNCPGLVPVGEGAFHHRLEQTNGGLDEPDNLMFVWGGGTVGGIGGCHHMIGVMYRDKAKKLGYLIIPEYVRPVKIAEGPAG